MTRLSDTKKDDIKHRIAAAVLTSRIACTTPGCKRPSMRSTGDGLAAFTCRYCVQRIARHGSAWHGTYKTAELDPHFFAACKWLAANSADGFVQAAESRLAAILEGAGEAIPATRLRGLPAERRCQIAFARLREAGYKPRRIFGVYLGTCALIEDDRGSHRTRDFKLVQVAKACHRLASGYHRHWDFPLSNGSLAPLEMHKYPRSSGLVLRKIGEEIDAACEIVAADHLEEIIASKRAEYGLHPSHLPGWRPEWQVKLLAQRGAA